MLQTVNTKQATIYKKAFLTKEQIAGILDLIRIPFDSNKKVVKLTEKEMKKVLAYDLEEVQIYPQIYNKFKEKIISLFFTSLADPKLPVGNVAVDASASISMQATLNTFHQSGQIESGGNDGIREAISLSKKRKVETSTIHFKNENLSFVDVLELKKEFMGMSVKNLADGNIRLHEINFNTINDIKDGDDNWWYKYSNLTMFYSQQTDHMTGQIYTIGNTIRSCIRLKLTRQKLFEFKLMLNEVADRINKEVYKLRTVNRDKVDVELYCIYSPTIYGIVDVFIRRKDAVYDYLLVSLIQLKVFEKIIVTGINEITNYYPQNMSVMSLIRAGKRVKGKLEIYLNNNRYIGVPFKKLFNLIRAAGYTLNLDDYCENTLFEYYPDMITEMRKEIILTANNYYFKQHSYYTVTILDNATGKCKLDVNLKYINSGYCAMTLDKVIKSDFLNPKIIETVKVEELEWLTIDTDDDFSIFESKLSSIKDNKLTQYCFARTIGSNFQSLLLHPMINKRKTFCNMYHQIFECLGIEATRNFLIYDFTNLFNSSDYVNPKHIEVIADTETHAGLCPMTSDGIRCQDRSSLSYASFDRVELHLFRAVLAAKKENTLSTDTCTMFGNKIAMGTGGFDVELDETKLELNETTEVDNSKYNFTNTRDNFFADQFNPVLAGEDDYMIEIPEIIPGRLKMLDWIYKNILIVDYLYYINKSINEIKRIRSQGPLPVSKKNTILSINSIKNYKRISI